VETAEERGGSYPIRESEDIGWDGFWVKEDVGDTNAFVWCCEVEGTEGFLERLAWDES